MQRHMRRGLGVALLAACSLLSACGSDPVPVTTTTEHTTTTTTAPVAPVAPPASVTTTTTQHSEQPGP